MRCDILSTFFIFIVLYLRRLFVARLGRRGLVPQLLGAIGPVLSVLMPYFLEIMNILFVDLYTIFDIIV